MTGTGGDRVGRTSVRPVSPPFPPVVFERIINPLVERLLRSPLHTLASDSLLLLTFAGRRSGREYTTPVGYVERDGTLFVTSQTDHTWWRNLRGGADVSVRLRGQRREGRADVVEDNRAVAEYVHGFLEERGVDAASRLALAVDGNEVPPVDELSTGLADVVVVRIELVGG